MQCVKPELTRHEKFEHLENPSGSKERFPCEICNKTYKNMSDLKRHKNMEHENPSGSKDRFPCGICNKTYINKPDFTRHEKSEHLENPSGFKERFPCEICNKTYKNKSDLKRHKTWNMKIHLDRKTYFLVKLVTKPT